MGGGGLGAYVAEHGQGRLAEEGVRGGRGVGGGVDAGGAEAAGEGGGGAAGEEAVRAELGGDDGVVFVVGEEVDGAGVAEAALARAEVGGVGKGGDEDGQEGGDGEGGEGRHGWSVRWMGKDRIWTDEGEAITRTVEVKKIS